MVGARVIGREPELEALQLFLENLSKGPAALVLQGDAGIGKTTLWREGVRLGTERSIVVLHSRPSESEAKLVFGTLADLVGGLPEELFSELPDPQRRALQVALLQVSPEGPSDWRPIAMGVLNMLHTMTGSGPVILAIDDVQWIDSSSVRVLQFVLRRLEAEPVGVLLTLRMGSGPEPLQVHTALLDGRRAELSIPPLPASELGEMLRSQVEWPFGHSELMQIYEITGGNPFFALEIARAFARGELQFRPGRPLAIPDNLRDLVKGRLASLTDAGLEVLVVASAQDRPTVSLTTMAIDNVDRVRAGITEAEEADLIAIDGDAISFTHPLLASTIYSEASPEHRLKLHARLSEVADSSEERARHFALAIRGHDSGVAAVLEEAATTARARGASDAAAALLAHAIRLTPVHDEEHLLRRNLLAGEAYNSAGDLERARSLLEEVAEKACAGSVRARALMRLAHIRYMTDSVMAAHPLLQQAFEDAADDPELTVLIGRALMQSYILGGDLRAAEDVTRAVSKAAQQSGDPGLEGIALSNVAFVDLALGRGLDEDMFERATAADGDVDPELPIEWRPAWAHAQGASFVNDFERSRELFHHLLDLFADRGDEGSTMVIHVMLGLMECWAGNWEVADRQAREALSSSFLMGRRDVRGAHAWYVRGLVDAHLGRVDDARAALDEGIRIANETGAVDALTWLMSAQGFLELSLGNPAGTHALLGALADMVQAVGLKEPGVLRFLPDEIEALIGIGELDKAEPMIDGLEGQGRSLDRPWATATALRCRGMLLAARGETEAALSALDESLVQHERVHQPFELARTQLAKGVVLRRSNQRRAARETLSEALEIFDGLGAALWSNRCRDELGRIGGRAASPESLTTAEQRVAELAAEGLTNREVADRLFVTVKTVEANLSRIYRKLGVRSRTELAHQLTNAIQEP